MNFRHPTQPPGVAEALSYRFFSKLMKMYASDPGRTTFETWATMERADQPGVIYAAGGATTIWVDFPRQKAVALPDGVRALVS